MERELKIVLTVFLTYLIFGLTSYFQTGSLITPIFLTKITLVILSVIFIFINFKNQDLWILTGASIALLSYAFTDDFVISYLNQKIPGFGSCFTTNNFWNWISFSVFFCFLFLSVFFLYSKTKNRIVFIFLISALIICLLLFFTNSGWIQEIMIKVFFLTYFIFCQQDSDLKNKTLRVLSYLYLGLILLESFEYFI